VKAGGGREKRIVDLLGYVALVFAVSVKEAERGHVLVGMRGMKKIQNHFLLARRQPMAHPLKKAGSGRISQPRSLTWPPDRTGKATSASRQG
jgi:hypothetical protein